MYMFITYIFSIDVNFVYKSLHSNEKMNPMFRHNNIIIDHPIPKTQFELLGIWT